MRSGPYILGLALMGVLALVCSLVSAQPYYSDHRSGVQVDVGIFYDDLAPYGEWVEMPEYGWSWAPRVSHGWRPYTRGQWVMTDDGWFWDSEEPFGWAAYHYGRWIDDPYYGWVWVPGTEWAPAWVSWRHGNGYTGWAPLPPRATWQTRVGLSIAGLDIDAFIGADDYAFVPDRSFVDRGVYQRVLPPTQNVTIINVTNNVTNYTVVNERVFNGGVALATVEQAVGRSVPRARTVDVDRPDGPRYTTPGEVSVFRPQVKAAPERRPAQGTSLVKGDQPPPLLMQRRSEREQEGRQRSETPAPTAKDVAQQRGQAREKAGDATTQPQTARPDVSSPQRARQATDAEAEAAKRARDAQQMRDQKQSDQTQRDQQQRDQQQMNQQHAKQATDAEAEAAKRARDAQQVPEQKQSEPKQSEQRQGNQPQADQQRPKPPQQEAKAKPKAKPKDEPKDKPKEEKK